MPITKEISVERILEALPSLPSSKQSEVSHIIAASLGACNYRLHMAAKEKAALKEEIAFHQSVYDLQMQYTQAILDAIRSGYHEFEESARNLLFKPVKRLLEAYEDLKNSASETALRNILMIFKENQGQLSSIVEMLETQDLDEESNGDDAMTLYGKEFMEKVDQQVKSHKIQLDSKLRMRQELKDEQERLDNELRQLVEDLEVKYEKQWLPGFQKNQNLSLDEIGVKEAEAKGYTSRSELSCDISVNNFDKSAHRSVENFNPAGLRDYLDEDYRKSDKEERLNTKSRKSRKGKEMPSGGQHTNSFSQENIECHNDSHDQDSMNRNPKKKTEEKFMKKKGEKTSWKPDKEWVNDFSETLDDLASAFPFPNKTQFVGREDSGLSENSFENVPTLPHLGKKKSKKKESLTYERNLNVAQRTLNLKK